jgi:hypothetical protein
VLLWLRARCSGRLLLLLLLLELLLCLEQGCKLVPADGGLDLLWLR